MSDDFWFDQRYQDAIFADHEEGHPGRPSPIAGCPFCPIIPIPEEISLLPIE